MSRKALIRTSRAVILRSGLTPGWFDHHASVDAVALRDAQRRVQWKLTVGPYSASVDDDVGFERHSDGSITDIHQLHIQCARDIRKVISRKKAEALLFECIGGPYEAPYVQFTAFGNGRTHLWFQARSVHETKGLRESSRWVVGDVDLSSGGCMRGGGGELPG